MKGFFKVWLAASVFYTGGLIMGSRWLDELSIGWTLAVFLVVLVSFQLAHWLFEDTYRRMYFRAPKHVLVQVKSEMGNIERIINPQPGGTYTIQVNDKTVNIKLKEDK